MIKSFFITLTLYAIVAYFTSAQKMPDEKVYCQETMQFSDFGMRDFKTCVILRNIEHEDYYLKSDINPSIELFNISNNKEVKYLPQDIGVKLPNLMQFKAEFAGLTIIRDFNLKKMRSLQFLGLYHNGINRIEPRAFVDLVKVERMHLDYNKLETLHENLFTSMASLQYLNLNDNQISFLNPLTFVIPNGALNYVELIDNVCVNAVFNSYSWDYLQPHLSGRCSTPIDF